MLLLPTSDNGWIHAIENNGSDIITTSGFCDGKKIRYLLPMLMNWNNV